MQLANIKIKHLETQLYQPLRAANKPPTELAVLIDEIIFCDTGMEYMELYRHIEKVIEYTGRPVTVLKPKHDFEYYLSEIVIQKGENAGKRGYGWPRLWNRWCTRAFKERLTRNYLRENTGSL